MDKEIAQVDGCEFTTEELQQFHQYYKHPWKAQEGVNERIAYFVKHIDPTVDSDRLRAWLRTMGIVDSSEQLAEAQAYGRFEGYDFARAPGFSETLGVVYKGKDRYEIEQRMEKAKARYYAEHVEPLDYDAYRRYRKENAPKPVCPYQHMWEDRQQQQKQAGDVGGFSRVRVVDLADHFKSGAQLTAAAMDSIRMDVEQAHGAQYYAAALVSAHCMGAREEKEGEEGDSVVFLPSLDQTTETVAQTMQAYVRLQITLRQLVQEKPVIMFASGHIDTSALGIVLSTADVVTTELFSVKVGPGDTPGCYPIPAVYDWAQLNAPEGTAEFIACNTQVLRGSEWAALGLCTGTVVHGKLGAAMDRILLAASCPPPHTRDALRKACAAESAYPGPSRITVWAPEIERLFVPLANGTLSMDGLATELRTTVKSPWAAKFLALDAEAMAVVSLRVAALRAVRQGNLMYSGALALELGATVAWAKGERSVDALLAASDPASVAESTAKTQPAAASGTLAEPLQRECPFAQMYRDNPERFKHVDLSAVAGHRTLDLH
ncbi:hypothetical protein EV175_002446 [Coemansia sp. RSA 1933]|nr:hypothetical protein EV175_002446 [Coemansia sp. RSA 1933]